jgi:hypothetical protein
MRARVLVVSCVSLAIACASQGASPRAPPDAASCPHGVIATRADYELVLYQADVHCPGVPQQFPSPYFQGTFCTSFGSAFEAGRCGLPRDLDRARLYYRRGCAIGFQVACSSAQRLGG